MHSILIEQATQVNAWDRVLIENGEKVRYAQYTYRTAHTGQCLGPCTHRKRRKGSLCIVYLQNRPHRSMLGTEQKTEKRFVMHSILIEQVTQVNAWDRVLIENGEKVRYVQYTYRTGHTGQCLGPCAHRKQRKGSLCIVYLQNSPHRSMLGTEQKTEKRFVMYSILIEQATQVNAWDRVLIENGEKVRYAQYTYRTAHTGQCLGQNRKQRKGSLCIVYLQNRPHRSMLGTEQKTEKRFVIYSILIEQATQVNAWDRIENREKVRYAQYTYRTAHTGQCLGQNRKRRKGSLCIVYLQNRSHRSMLGTEQKTEKRFVMHSILIEQPTQVNAWDRVLIENGEKVRYIVYLQNRSHRSMLGTGCSQKTENRFVMHSILIEQPTQVNAWDRVLIENGEKVRYAQYTYRTGHTGQCLGPCAHRKRRKGSLCIVYLQNRSHRSMLWTEQKTEKRFVMHSILIEQATQVNAWDRIENGEKVRYAQYTYRTAHTGQCLGQNRKWGKGSLCIVYLQNSPHRSMLGTVYSQKTEKRFVMHSILIEQATQVNAWDRIENGEKVRYAQYTYRTGHTGQCLGQNRKRRKGSLCIVYLQNRSHRSMLGTEQKTEKRFVMHSILIEQATQVNAWDRIENREKVRYVQYTYRTGHTSQCLGQNRKQRKGSLCIVYLQNRSHRSMLGTEQKTEKRFVMHSILIEQATQVNAWDSVLIENGEKVRYAQYTYRTAHTGQCLGQNRKRRKGSLCIVYLQNRSHRSMLGTEQKTEKRFVMHSILIEQATQVNAWDRIENREKVRYVQYTYRTGHTGQCLGQNRKRRKGSLCIVYLQNRPHRSMLGTVCSQKTEKRFVMYSILIEQATQVNAWDRIENREKVRYIVYLQNSPHRSMLGTGCSQKTEKRFVMYSILIEQATQVNAWDRIRDNPGMGHCQFMRKLWKIEEIRLQIWKGPYIIYPNMQLVLVQDPK